MQILVIAYGMGRSQSQQKQRLSKQKEKFLKWEKSHGGKLAASPDMYQESDSLLHPQFPLEALGIARNYFQEKDIQATFVEILNLKTTCKCAGLCAHP